MITIYFFVNKTKKKTTDLQTKIASKKLPFKKSVIYKLK